MATKLQIFNLALTELGNRPLVDTGEDVKAGRVLNALYDRVVADCLEAGSWNFAMETVKLDSDTGVTPNFGYKEVFAKPTDWVRTYGISQDEYLVYPLFYYYDDVNYWSADTSPIYVRYVSNDTGLGLELNRWTANFTRFVELELAERSCYQLTQNRTLMELLGQKRDKARLRALNSDAMNEPQPKFTPPGSWSTSRAGRTGLGDRGSRSRLTG